MRQTRETHKTNNDNEQEKTGGFSKNFICINKALFRPQYGCNKALLILIKGARQARPEALQHEKQNRTKQHFLIEILNEAP